MKRLTLLVLTLVLAFAPAAGAASWLDPGERTYIPVAAGVIEHTVYEYELMRDGRTYLEGNRLETFVASDRSRNVTFHPNGSLTSEDVVAGGEWRHFTAETNTIRVSGVRFPGRPVVPNRATQAAILREQVKAGWLKVAERTARAGRAVHVLVDGPNDPDRAYNSERLVVDARTYVELEGLRWSTGSGPDGSRVDVISRRTLVVEEELDRATHGDKLVMLPHPTAVEHGTAYSAKLKRKAAKTPRKRYRRATR
jgi:hypothetical protein